MSCRTRSPSASLGALVIGVLFVLVGSGFFVVSFLGIVLMFVPRTHLATVTVTHLLGVAVIASFGFFTLKFETELMRGRNIP
jgi:multisubunit Na+/H+ antiporter MnhG subunit